MLLPYVKIFMTKFLHLLNVYNYGTYVKILMFIFLYRLNVYNYMSYVKILRNQVVNTLI
jgi:hypothetical protein